MDKTISIPSDVRFIIDTLRINGFDSYVVGGCVRDSILGREPNDWDITTEALPEEVIKLFDKVILTGIKHGTVTIIINNQQYEVTTYRCDGEYEDGRHPKKVEFVRDLKEDLARRDFTINAIAYNDESGIVDYFNGIDDLNDKVIKTVGKPEKRFKEDALRMLRAVRFSAQLNFNIDEKTENALKNMAEFIEKISKERIRDEFNKIILSNPKKIDDLERFNLLKYIITNYNYSSKIKKEKLLYMEKAESKIYLRLAILFYGLSSLEIENILKELRYDNETIKRCIELVKYNDYKFTGMISIKKLLKIIGIDRVKDLIKIQMACVQSKDINNLINAEKELEIIIAENQCFNLKNLKINGRDLIELGFEKGGIIGSILDEILDNVIENKIKNEKDKLLKYACEKL